MEVDADQVSHVISTDAAQITVSGEPKIGEVATSDLGAFVEVLDKHDAVLHRARYENMPISIGNSYRCDHVIDSEASGDYRVKLLRDDDGVLRVQSPYRFWAPGGLTLDWAVDPDAAFIVAGERVRIRTRDYAPSRRAPAGSAIAWLGGWTTLAAIAGALGVTALQAWLADIDGDRFSNYVTGALGILGMISIWAGIWAIVSRLNGKSSHFLAHLSLASIAVVAIWLIDFVVDTVAYGFNASMLSRYSYVLFALCVAALVWCHTRYIVRTRTLSAVTTAIAFGLAAFAMQATNFYSLRGSLASSLTMTETRPPGWRFVSGSNIDQLFSEAAKLEQRAIDSKSEKPEGIDYGSYGE